MSAGAFEKATYTTDAGVSYFCRAQPESKGFTANSVANAYGTVAPAAGAPKIKLSGGRRAIGVRPRLVRFKFTADAPDGYDDATILQIPVFTKTAYDAYGVGSTGTYLGVAIEVVGRTPEVIR